MIAAIQDSPLYKIANPGSIAFFGASNNPSAMGTSILNSIRDLGFEGALYPVHPKETTVQNLAAFPSVADLPRIPDLAVLVLPTRIVVETLDACGRKGIRHAIVVSGGFTEVGKEGIRLQQEVAAVAKKHGIRFLGGPVRGAGGCRQDRECHQHHIVFFHLGVFYTRRFYCYCLCGSVYSRYISECRYYQA